IHSNFPSANNFRHLKPPDHDSTMVVRIPGAVPRRSAVKIKLDRIISIATLCASLIAVFLVLKKLAPVATPQPAAAVAANAQTFQEKIQQLDTPKQPGQAPAESHLSSDEVSAAITQAAGAIPAVAAPQAPNQGTSGISTSSQETSLEQCYTYNKAYQA